MTATDTHKDDRTLPYRIENTDIRGQIIELGASVNDVLTRHDYPRPVSQLLGESLVLAAMMGAALKFAGRLILQLQGNGPLDLLVADFVSPGTIRGYARFDAARVAALSDDYPKLVDLMGKGHLAITIDQDLDKDRYQGIVELQEESLSQCALTYFGQSEQILTGLRLAVAEHINGNGQRTWRAGGVMAQSLPPQILGESGATEKSLDDWERINILLNTAEDHELTDPLLPAEQLLYRLFHEDGVRVFEAKDIAFGCSCKEDTIRTTIQNFSDDDRSDMTENGVISARCEFCNTTYCFDPSDFV